MPSKPLRVLAELILLVAGACAVETAQPAPHLTPALGAPATAALPTPAGDALLRTSGPWLVVITPNGVWALNPDGTGLTEVFEGHVLAPQDVTAMPAPSGGKAAFITGDPLYRELTLQLLRLPEGTVQSMPLIAPEFQNQAAPEGPTAQTPAGDAARAVVELTSLAWSPDGQTLAFIGALDGPSADLYALRLDRDASETALTRWTNAPGQEAAPLWSPDGRYVLHAEVERFGLGAGHGLGSVWAVDTRSGAVVEVYLPEGSAAESFLGWQDEDTFLVYSWTPECGSERLRLVDVPGGETRMVWEGAFNGAALAPEAGERALLITVDAYAAGCRGGEGPGLFLLFAPEYFGVFELLREEAFLPVWSSEGRTFLARTASHVYAVGQREDVIDVAQLDAPAPALPATSPEGRLAWALPSGVWVGALDAPPVQVFSAPASLPIWGEDGETLFFFAEGGMFVARAPDFTPQLWREGLLGTGAFWVPR